MASSFWNRWFPRTYREPTWDPRFWDEDMLRQCREQLADPDYTRHDPYHAELAKKRLAEHDRLAHKKWHELNPMHTFPDTPGSKREILWNDVATAKFEVYDYLEKINAAKEKAKKFE